MRNPIKVYVISPSAYDDYGEIEVFTSRKLAEEWLEENGFTRCDNPYELPEGCGCCPSIDWWHNTQDWMKTEIEEKVLHAEKQA